MGFPLSRFYHLARLCENHTQEFAPFKLVAIVVPSSTDNSVRREIQYHFTRLHEITGETMAFIAFCEPPRDWKQKHQHWMKIKESLSSGVDEHGDSLFLRNLQDRLCLPDDTCLLLTNDLLSDKYLVIPTDSDSIVSQLEELGQYANLPNSIVSTGDDTFLSFLDTLGSVYEESTSNGKSLAENIAIMSAVQNLESRFFGEYADIWVGGEIKRLYGVYQRAVLEEESADGETIDAALEAYSNYLIYVLRDILGRPDEFFDSPGWRPRRRQERCLGRLDEFFDNPGCSNLGIDIMDVFYPWEEVSKDYIFSYNTVAYSFLERPMMRSKGFIHEIPKDYSPLGCYLGKIVEEEINASLVQYLRNLMGIRMPEFYRVYDRNSETCVVETPAKVYLNNYRQNYGNSADPVPDKIIAVGQVVKVIETMASGPYSFDPSILQQEDFLNPIRDFSHLRNRAGHAGEVFGFEDARIAHEKFKNLVSKIFPTLMNLKRKMSGRQ